MRKSCLFSIVFPLVEFNKILKNFDFYLEKNNRISSDAGEPIFSSLQRAGEKDLTFKISLRCYWGTCPLATGKMWDGMFRMILSYLNLLLHERKRDR